ncbi:MAG: protein kinase [Desulfurivibrionaceae bacterium]
MGDLKKLGKYAIQSTIGQGAMGVVYRGFDPNIERTVAIKTIRKDALNKEERQSLLARFKREAQAAGRLTHPGIVTVYDYDEDGDNAFIAMEYVHGRELKEYLDSNQRFSLNTVIDIISQLLDALIYSHARGVVHRDIKPGNILVLDTGRIKVMDFGIARIESSTLTQFGDVLGTPSYMAPEQCSGQPVDKRSDLYSTGGILYHLITGEKPFNGDSITSIIHQVMATEAPLVSKINSQAPPFLDEVVRKALAKDPDHRFQTAEEFKAAFTRESLAGEIVLAELSGKTNTELREMCGAAGITGISKKNKKQLIEALQDTGNNGSTGTGTNLPSAEIATAAQRLDAIDLANKQKEYDKTVVEQVLPEQRLRKLLKRTVTLLLLTILVTIGFTAWTIYSEELTYLDLRQITAEKAKDTSASAYDQLMKKSKVISASAYDRLKTIVKEKYKEVSGSTGNSGQHQ